MSGGPPPPKTVSGFIILATIFHAFALILTSFRLWFRYHTRRLWWDDFWVTLALICDAVCMVALWIINAPVANPYSNIEALPTSTEPRRVHIAGVWLNILCYTCSIWFGRISIAFSVLRIVPPARSVSMTAYGASAAFACMWIYLFTCKSVVCSTNTAWYNSTTSIRCPIPTWLALSEVITDTLSDFILVALPLCLLWRVKLPSNQRIMILAVFSASILVSVVSAAHTAYLLKMTPFFGGFTATMESAVSLIVCNLLVIITFLYRVLRNGRDLTEGISGKNTKSSNRLTTVDLDVSGGSWFSPATSTPYTGTNISNLSVTNRGDKDTTFGSIVTGGPEPPVMVNADTSHVSITMK